MFLKKAAVNREALKAFEIPLPEELKARGIEMGGSHGP